MTSRLARIHDALRHFEPATITTDNIWGYLWGKMGYGSLLFASALTNASIVDVLDARDARGVLTALAREVMAVAAAERVTVMGFNGYDPAAFGPHGTAQAIEASFDAMVAFNRRSAKTHSGVWRDIAVHHRQTEIDAQFMPVQAVAGRHGIANAASGSPRVRHARGRKRRAQPDVGESGADGTRGPPMQIRFDGQTAIVTGAAHGFGRAIALRFARLGARVVGWDVVGAELDETARLAAAEGLRD